MYIKKSLHFFLNRDVIFISIHPFLYILKFFFLVCFSFLIVIYLIEKANNKALVYFIKALRSPISVLRYFLFIYLFYLITHIENILRFFFMHISKVKLHYINFIHILLISIFIDQKKNAVK